ncbi:MAG: hypothetical protein WKF43_06520 [Acidimicrobiales bacterium]
MKERHPLTGDPGLVAVLDAAGRRLAPHDDEDPVPFVALPVPRARDRVVALIGPGVVRRGHASDVRAFAAMTGVAVLNTYGAKGVLRWDEPSHAGTVGLQRDDFALAGVLDADLVVTSGLDLDECRLLVLDPDQTIDVPPSHLRFAAGGWPPPWVAPSRSTLYERLAAVVGPMYASEATPLPPPAAAAALVGRGRVTADAGRAGFWVARSFPTTEPGTVVVPARSMAGFAAAAGLLSGLDGRSAIAVVSAPLDDMTRSVLELARLSGAQLVVQVWGDPDALPAPSSSDGVTIETVAVDWSVLDRLVAVAGPITAWTA